MPNFSDTIVYVDESGDHSLEAVDPQFPVFSLAFCLFDKSRYSTEVVRHLQQLKFSYFGHDMVVLHEREIRKQTGEFAFQVNPALRTKFIDDLSSIVERSPFCLIAVVIDKKRLSERYVTPNNPYALALKFGLERIAQFLHAQGQAERLTHVVVESRGKREDEQLELEFLKVCGGENYRRQTLPFGIRFASKLSNSAGLQLADLVARPISRHVLNPEQPNRAFDVLRNKFYRNDRGEIEGFGLKVFP